VKLRITLNNLVLATMLDFSLMRMPFAVILAEYPKLCSMELVHLVKG
jgi:hypothetical protein